MLATRRGAGCAFSSLTHGKGRLGLAMVLLGLFGLAEVHLARDMRWPLF
jgi:hypothetical protein